MIAASERKYGTKDLTGKRVSVQGVGHVGVFLVEHLVKAGAIVTICDVNDLSVKNMQQKFNVAAVEADKIYDVPCDIYSPNAIGLTVNDKTLARLTCSIIAGGANNQLPDPTIYATIIGKNILYCPDFAINAGGITSVAAEYLPGGYNQQWLRTRVEAIYDTIHKVLAEAEARNRFPEVVAIDLAKERIAKQEAANKSWKQPAMCCNG